jgi:23S rRNA maturation-related 3'-5' exoribonuclease YhaM
MIILTGSRGQAGITGHQGTSGPGGYQITDWKEDIQKKYNNRFIIKTDYDTMSFAPTNIITDTKTNKEYEFKPSNISDIMNETDRYIQQLIITIRDKKINDIINDTES